MLSAVINQKESVSIPSVVMIKNINYKVTKLAPDLFKQNTTIKSLVIGGNVTVIGDNAFNGCTNLMSVTGGARLVTIGTSAFAGCPNLKTFKITSSALAKISPFTFNGDTKLKTLYIKKTTKLTKGGVKQSLKGSSLKTVKVKKSKVKKYKKIFKKSNSGRKVKVKK